MLNNMNKNLPINLIIADNNTKLKEVFEMMVNEKGIKEYYEDKLSRIIMSTYSFIIKYEDKTAGFINLIKEDENNNFLFLDIGVKEEYRKKRIATEMIKFLSLIPIDDYIIVIASNNYLNKIAKKVGVKVCDYNKQHVYLLQKDKYVKFKQDKELVKLEQYFNPTNYIKF